MSLGEQVGVCSRLLVLKKKDTDPQLSAYAHHCFLWFFFFKVVSLILSLHWRFNMLGGWMRVIRRLIRQSLKPPRRYIIPDQAAFECVSKHLASRSSRRRWAVWASPEFCFLTTQIQCKCENPLLFSLLVWFTNYCLWGIRLCAPVSHVFTGAVHHFELCKWFVWAPVLGRSCPQFFFFTYQKINITTSCRALSL